MDKQKRKQGCSRMSHTQTDRHIRTHSRIGGARERSKERLANGEGNESDGRERANAIQRESDYWLSCSFVVCRYAFNK